MARLVYLIPLLTIALGGLGCTLEWTPAPRLPETSELVKEQLVVHSDFRLPKTHRLVDELVALRTDISRRLGTPLSDEPIHVYLFQSPSDYRQFVTARFPHLPDRRAWFVETDTRLAVFAHWGDTVADDLRHEVTHGYLHSTTQNIPIWLDEGLAEYFESPRGSQGQNDRHLRLLGRRYSDGAWHPDLKRLERMRDPAEMSQQDYAECWAWVVYMMESRTENAELLRNYLARLRATGVVPPVSEFLGEEDPRAGKKMLEMLRDRAASLKPAKRLRETAAD